MLQEKFLTSLRSSYQSYLSLRQESDEWESNESKRVPQRTRGMIREAQRIRVDDAYTKFVAIARDCGFASPPLAIASLTGESSSIVSPSSGSPTSLPLLLSTTGRNPSYNQFHSYMSGSTFDDRRETYFRSAKELRTLLRNVIWLVISMVRIRLLVTGFSRQRNERAIRSYHARTISAVCFKRWQKMLVVSRRGSQARLRRCFATWKTVTNEAVLQEYAVIERGRRLARRRIFRNCFICWMRYVKFMHAYRQDLAPPVFPTDCVVWDTWYQWRINARSVASRFMGGPCGRTAESETDLIFFMMRFRTMFTEWRQLARQRAMQRCLATVTAENVSRRRLQRSFYEWYWAFSLQRKQVIAARHIHLKRIRRGFLAFRKNVALQCGAQKLRLAAIFGTLRKVFTLWRTRFQEHHARSVRHLLKLHEKPSLRSFLRTTCFALLGDDLQVLQARIFRRWRLFCHLQKKARTNLALRLMERSATGVVEAPSLAEVDLEVSRMLRDAHNQCQNQHKSLHTLDSSATKALAYGISSSIVSSIVSDAKRATSQEHWCGFNFAQSFVQSGVFFDMGAKFEESEPHKEKVVPARPLFFSAPATDALPQAEEKSPRPQLNDNLLSMLPGLQSHAERRNDRDYFEMVFAEAGGTASVNQLEPAQQMRLLSLHAARCRRIVSCRYHRVNMLGFVAPNSKRSEELYKKVRVSTGGSTVQIFDPAEIDVDGIIGRSSFTNPTTSDSFLSGTDSFLIDGGNAHGTDVIPSEVDSGIQRSDSLHSKPSTTSKGAASTRGTLKRDISSQSLGARSGYSADESVIPTAAGVSSAASAISMLESLSHSTSKLEVQGLQTKSPHRKVEHEQLLRQKVDEMRGIRHQTERSMPRIVLKKCDERVKGGVKTKSNDESVLAAHLHGSITRIGVDHLAAGNSTIDFNHFVEDLAQSTSTKLGLADRLRLQASGAVQPTILRKARKDSRIEFEKGLSATVSSRVTSRVEAPHIPRIGASSRVGAASAVWVGRKKKRREQFKSSQRKYGKHGKEKGDCIADPTSVPLVPTPVLDSRVQLPESNRNPANHVDVSVSSMDFDPSVESKDSTKTSVGNVLTDQVACSADPLTEADTHASLASPLASLTEADTPASLASPLAPLQSPASEVIPNPQYEGLLCDAASVVSSPRESKLQESFVLSPSGIGAVLSFAEDSSLMQPFSQEGIVAQLNQAPASARRQVLSNIDVNCCERIQLLHQYISRELWRDSVDAEGLRQIWLERRTALIECHERISLALEMYDRLSPASGPTCERLIAYVPEHVNSLRSSSFLASHSRPSSVCESSCNSLSSLFADSFQDSHHSLLSLLVDKSPSNSFSPQPAVAMPKQGKSRAHRLRDRPRNPVSRPHVPPPPSGPTSPFDSLAPGEQLRLMRHTQKQTRHVQLSGLVGSTTVSLDPVEWTLPLETPADAIESSLRPLKIGNIVSPLAVQSSNPNQVILGVRGCFVDSATDADKEFTLDTLIRHRRSLFEPLASSKDSATAFRMAQQVHNGVFGSQRPFSSSLVSKSRVLLSSNPSYIRSPLTNRPRPATSTRSSTTPTICPMDSGTLLPSHSSPLTTQRESFTILRRNHPTAPPPQPVGYIEGLQEDSAAQKLLKYAFAAHPLSCPPMEHHL